MEGFGKYDYASTEMQQSCDKVIAELKGYDIYHAKWIMQAAIDKIERLTVISG